LARRYPDSFTAAYGRPPEETTAREKWLDEKCREALRLGRKGYVGEGCWHCHSQFVRPVSNEDRRWGPGPQTKGDPNEPQRPRRPRPEPRGRPAVQRLARRPFLQADDALGGLAHARVPLVLRRLPRQAQCPRPGPDDLHPVARLLARELPLLRRLQAIGRLRD